MWRLMAHLFSTEWLWLSCESNLHFSSQQGPFGGSTQGLAKGQSFLHSFQETNGSLFSTRIEKHSPGWLWRGYGGNWRISGVPEKVQLMTKWLHNCFQQSKGWILRHHIDFCCMTKRFKKKIPSPFSISGEGYFQAFWQFQLLCPSGLCTGSFVHLFTSLKKIIERLLYNRNVNR